MTSKKFLTYFVMLFILVALAACNAANSSNESSTTEPETNEGNNSSEAEKEEVELRFTWWGDTKRHEIYNEIVDLFEEKYPHIIVKREYGSFNDYWDRLTTQIAGGNAPDIIGMHQRYVSDFARRGAVISLDEYIDSGVINLDDFPQAVKDSGKISGETVMVAQGVTMSGQAFHTGLFDKLGVEYPDMNWTWEDYADKARELKAANPVDGFWGASDLSRDFDPGFNYFVRQNGKQLFTEDGQIGFEREDVIEWFTMWDEMRQEGIIPDAATSTEFATLPLEQSLLVTGKVGVGAIPANQIHLYQQQFDEGEVRMVRHPNQADGEVGEYIEGAYLSITKGSKHPDEAALFIDFFVNTEEAMKIFKLEQGSPGSTKMVEAITPLLDPAQVRTLDYLSETFEIAVAAPYPPEGYLEIESAFESTSEAIAFGQSSIEDAVDEFMASIESILE